MENERGTLRILWLFIVLESCSGWGFASDPPLPQPVATLALSAMHPSGQGESAWATVAFSSETSIAVGLCRQDCTDRECSLFLVRWEGGTLRPFAQTLRFDPGVSIHPATEGQILTVQSLPPTVLYSADLSTAQDLPKQLSRVSPTGKTVAESARGSWKLYRLTDRLEPLREGTGRLWSVSDSIVVIQDGKVMKVETVDGKHLGSFSVPPEERGYASADLLGGSKISLDDCNGVRIVDFDGRTELKVHPRKGCSVGDTRSSADGRRMLFDFTDRKVLGLQHVLESVRTITTFGMTGPEDVNREEVQVIDTISGKSCFDWHRSFPMTYSRVRSAAISPSGESVAIAAGNTLSMYRLPAVCEASTIAHDK
jgi:hypothetical protein